MPEPHDDKSRINGIVRELWEIKNKLNQLDGLYLRIKEMDKTIKELKEDKIG